MSSKANPTPSTLDTLAAELPTIHDTDALASFVVRVENELSSIDVRTAFQTVRGWHLSGTAIHTITLLARESGKTGADVTPAEADKVLSALIGKDTPSRANISNRLRAAQYVTPDRLDKCDADRNSAHGPISVTNARHLLAYCEKLAGVKRRNGKGEVIPQTAATAKRADKARKAAAEREAEQASQAAAKRMAVLDKAAGSVIVGVITVEQMRMASDDAIMATIQALQDMLVLRASKTAADEAAQIKADAEAESAAAINKVKSKNKVAA